MGSWLAAKCVHVNHKGYECCADVMECSSGQQNKMLRRRLFTGTGAPCSNEEATLESVIQNSAADISAEALLEELVAKDKASKQFIPQVLY
eukprot:4084161-Amphidinium_carterae.1